VSIPKSVALGLDRFRAALDTRRYKPASSSGNDGFAAVAAILRERDGVTEILLMRRATHDRDPWSGHMAFPGGRQDPSDGDLLATVVRETEEEIGLRLEPTSELIGRLDDLPAVVRGRRVGLVIAPFVFAVTGDPEFSPNKSEVEELLWAPVAPMLSGERDTTLLWEFEGQKIEVPGYDVEGRIVWGLTHRMLGALFEALDEHRERG
jgi:8-oxo-dGTP pyrophosphatase MutT (NUDIX family)